MRICFVSRRYFPAISGMSVYAQNFLRELVAAGHDVTMISQYRGDPLGTRVYGGGPPPAVPGVRVIGLEQVGEQEGGDFERDVDTIVDTIAAEHGRAPFDILHAQYGYPTGWAVLLASQRLGVPNVVSIQGGDGHWVGSCCETHRLAMTRVLDHAGAVLIGGESFVDEVAGRLGTARERFTIVPGAVDTARFHPADGGAAGPADGPLRIFYHGRVDRRKGALDFIDALALLRERGIEVAATVSGIGPDLDASRVRAAEHNLESVRFSGYAAYDTVPSLYREADIFASPTYAEGFSNTVLEAMASGLAIASCRSVGIVDCLRDGDNAILTEAGDIAAHADALERLVTDPALRARLSGAALAECRATYSWEVVARQIMAIYGRLAGTAPDLGFPTTLPLTPCRFRAEPHLL
ncbi:glycosyltransferase family 4 protein [uncultured Enterovirga sp.]|uniref:glycosyltransferase family 4 protein n=1 Tax=uncultured Enterovirga sp. TaxID=2026352 RepID=UPI0035CA9273